MGKAARFFKSLLGFKTTDSSKSSHSQPKNKQRRWSFVSQQNPRPHRRRKAAKSLDGNSLQHNHANEDEHPSKRAFVHAAEVVRVMTIRTTGCGFHSELAAAIKIQSYFRAYLARRALRALKALVKLQALVRGHILRKHTADMMRRLQALIRAQARARALRSQATDLTTNLSSHIHAHHRGPPTPQKSEHFPHTKQDHNSISKRNNSKSYARGQERTFLDGLTNHERYKTVEVDTERRFLQPDQISFAYSQSMTTSRGSTFQPTNSSPCASCEVNSFDDSVRGGGVSTPIKSDGSKSCYGGYFDHPNYMANTESSRAKARSLSAPKMRPQLEVSNATKRDPGYKYVSAGMQQVSTMRESFTKKAYPGSGRLDRLGMPVYGNVESEFCVSYWN